MKICAVKLTFSGHFYDQKAFVAGAPELAERDYEALPIPLSW